MLKAWGVGAWTLESSLGQPKECKPPFEFYPGLLNSPCEHVGALSKPRCRAYSKPQVSTARTQGAQYSLIEEYA